MVLLGERRGCGARDPHGRRQAGFDWVRSLTSPALGDDAALRIVALNCHDARAEKYIREVLLGEPTFTDATRTRGSLPTDPRTRTGEGGRLVDEVDLGGDTLARLGDLDETRRAKLGQDDAVAQAIGGSVQPDEFARAARYLNLTFARAIAASPGVSSSTVAYLHERPRAEEQAAVVKPDLLVRAAAQVHPNLLVVFPSLADPKQLAAALGRDSGLLGLLLAGSDPNRIADLISREPVLPKAEAILDAQPQLTAKLPRYKNMTPQARAAIDRLDKAVDEDSEARAALDDVKSGEADTDKAARLQGRRLDEAAKQHTLVEAIAMLGTKHDKATMHIQDERQGRQALRDEQRLAETDALALLELHKSEVPALLSDRTLRASVDKLSAMVDLPPDVAIPWIGSAELSRMPNALHWWMTFRDPTALLHHLQNNAEARALVAGALGANTLGAAAWLERMPKAAALDSAEGRVLDQLRPLMRGADGMRALFKARFGMPSPAEYDVKTLDRLWELIARLPPGHIKQERITRISRLDLGEHTAGMYGTGTGDVMIDDEVKPGVGTDDFYPESVAGWFTAEQMKQVYGYDDARLALLDHQGRLDKIQDHGVDKLRLKKQEIELFTQVVLHEVGHAVDELLGSRTPPVWDFAGWHEYSDATFDDWAAEMGGWDKVSTQDRSEIKKVWIDAARGKTSVDKLVGPDHPALAAKYASVGIVHSGRAGKTLNYMERVQHGDRIFVAGSSLDAWYSVRAEAAKSAPSYYSLNAPAEYFAESYVEYYRGVDGTPGSQAKKGGALAGPVKQWFDANVDTIKYDPRRFAGGATASKGP